MAEEVGPTCRPHGANEKYKILIIKAQGKRNIGKSGHRWEGNIKMSATEIGYEGVDWVKLDQDRFHWWVFVNTGLWVPYMKEISSSAERLIVFSRNILCRGVSNLIYFTNRERIAFSTETGSPWKTLHVKLFWIYSITNKFTELAVCFTFIQRGSVSLDVNSRCLRIHTSVHCNNIETCVHQYKLFG
jgi:hypothetical protein